MRRLRITNSWKTEIQVCLAWNQCVKSKVELPYLGRIKEPPVAVCDQSDRFTKHYKPLIPRG